MNSIFEWGFTFWHEINGKKLACWLSWLGRQTISLRFRIFYSRYSWLSTTINNDITISLYPQIYPHDIQLYQLYPRGDIRKCNEFHETSNQKRDSFSASTATEQSGRQFFGVFPLLQKFSQPNPLVKHFPSVSL